MIKQILIFILGVILMGCSTDKQHKTEQQMEPRILAIGRLQSTLNVFIGLKNGITPQLSQVAL